MRVRLAKVSEITEIIKCEELAFDMTSVRGNTRDESQKEFLESQIQEGEIHVISDSIRLLGYISFAPFSDHVFVDSIAVLPSLQRKGLGTRLLHQAEQAASNLQLGSVRLFTDGTIPGNKQFYRQQGYRETGRCEEDAVSRIFYSKEIAC